MSSSAIYAFIEKVNVDTELQHKVAALHGNVKELVSLASQTGYTFTMQEWHAVTGDQLSESDLDNVSGGIIVQGGITPLPLMMQQGFWSSFSNPTNH